MKDILKIISLFILSNYISVFFFLLLQIFDDHYHFEHKRIVKRSFSSSHDMHSSLEEEPEVYKLKYHKYLRG